MTQAQGAIDRLHGVRRRPERYIELTRAGGFV